MSDGTVLKGVNLNTWVSLVGFLSLFSGIIFSYASLQAEQTNFGKFVEEQKGLNARFDTRLDTQETSIRELPRMGDRMARLEEADKAGEERISRIVDSYSTRFSEISTKLNSLETQLALVKQGLDRIEAWREDRRREAFVPSSEGQR